MRKKASVSSGSGRARVPTAEQPVGLGLGLGLEARGVLVVVELGGEWPSRADAAGTTKRVLAQAEGETPAAFGERVVSRLDGLFGRGVHLATVVLACNERVDTAAESARRKVLSFGLGTMAKQKSGSAHLAACARSSGRLRHALSALARGLFDEWRTAGLEVSVDFGEESRSENAAAPTFLFTARVA